MGITVCENVTIIDDEDIVEPDQSFSVTASSTDPVNIEPISMAVVTIIDNDGEAHWYNIT